MPKSIVASLPSQVPHRPCALILCVAALVVSISGYASAQPYRVQKIVPGTGAVTQVNAVNDQGQVVGQYVDGAGVVRPFLWKDGDALLTPLPTLGGLGGSARAINVYGQIVGWAKLPDGRDQAAIWNAATPLVVSALGTLRSGNTGESYAYAINDTGAVTGKSQALTGWGGFIWRMGTMEALDPAAAPYVESGGIYISGNGHVLMEKSDYNQTGDNRTHYYTWHEVLDGAGVPQAVLQRIPVPDDRSIVLSDAKMNDSGRVIGNTTDQITMRPFTWFGGVFSSPLPAGATQAQIPYTGWYLGFQPVPTTDHFLVNTLGSDESVIWNGIDAFGPELPGGAWAMNSSDVVVGYRSTGTGPDLRLVAYRAAVVAGQAVSADLFGTEYCGRFNSALQIDDTGAAFGLYAPSGNGSSLRAFVQAGALSPSDLTPAGAEQSQTTLLSRSGNVVGKFTDDSVEGWFYASKSSFGALAPAITEANPLAVCQNLTLVADDTGVASTTPEAIAGGSTSACHLSFASLSGNLTNLPIGVHTVQVSVTDPKGRSAQCTATITVIDQTPPSLTCPPNVTFTYAYEVALTTQPVATDLSLPIVVSNNAPSIFPGGATTTVVWTATDANGNSSTCQQLVTVVEGGAACDAPPDLGQLYDVVKIAPAGAYEVVPKFVNASGAVAGDYLSDTGQQSAFYWKDGVFAVIGALGTDAASKAVGLNDAGQVLATSTTYAYGTDSRAFLWRDGINSGPIAPTRAGYPYQLAAYDLFLSQRGDVLARWESWWTYLWRPTIDYGAIGSYTELWPLTAGGYVRPLGLNGLGQALLEKATLIGTSGNFTYAYAVWAPVGGVAVLPFTGNLSGNIVLGAGGHVLTAGSRWLAGNTTTLSPLPGDSAAGPDFAGGSPINGLGEVVGFSTSPLNSRRLVFWPADAVPVDLGPLQLGSAVIARNTSALAFTKDNRATRWTKSCGTSDLWAGHCANNSKAEAISGDGQVVVGPFGQSKTFVHAGGAAFDLTPPGGHLSAWKAVGATGVVAGTYYETSTNKKYGFVALPLAPGATAQGATVAPMPFDQASALCKANIDVVLSASGTATITPAMINNGSTSPTGCGPVSLSASPLTFTAVGTYPVTLTVSAGHALPATCPATVTVKPLDLTPPVITPTYSPDKNSNGWNNTSVTLTWSFNDPESGVASTIGCAPESFPLAETSTTGESRTCTATNGHGQSASVSAVVRIDLTPPTLNGTLVSGTCLPASGWCSTDIELGLSCTDALSGVAQCPGNVTVSGEGVFDVPPLQFADNAGNQGSLTGQVKIDKTPPTITELSRTGTAGWNQSVTVTFDCGDALSGVASCAPVTVDTEGANQTAVGVAIDLAGNTATAEATGINIDATAPALTCPIGKAVLSATEAQAWATATSPASATDSLDTSPVIYCLEATDYENIFPLAGHSFAGGTTALYCAAIDHAGNRSNICPFDVFVPTKNGDKCSSDAGCISGFCVDGVCCDSACGGGVTTDCQACSKAAGAAADGVCGPLKNSPVSVSELATSATTIGLRYDSGGVLYFSDEATSQIKRLYANGNAEVVVGNGDVGLSPDDTEATQAFLDKPYGIAFRKNLSTEASFADDPSETLYFAEANNGLIRKVNKYGKLVTVAGGGTLVGSLGDGSPATQSALVYPTDVAFDSKGDLYIADLHAGSIRKVDMATGLISTVTTALVSTVANSVAVGRVVTLRFDNADNLYFSAMFPDESGSPGESGSLYRIAAIAGNPGTGAIERIAGAGLMGFSPDGPAKDAALSPIVFGIDIHPTTQEVYFTDTYGYRIRRIDADGNMWTVLGAGTGIYNGVEPGADDYLGGALTFGKGGGLVFSDVIRKRIVSATWALTTCATGSACGSNAACFSDFCVDGVCCDNACGGGVTTDCQACSKAAGAAEDGVCGPLVANPGGSIVSDLITPAFSIIGLRHDSQGALYFSDLPTGTIKKRATDGQVTTVVGSGNEGFSPDGTPAVDADLGEVYGLALDANDALYFAEAGNQRVRKVDAAGKLVTVAGGGTAGDGVLATESALFFPADIAFDSYGDLYIADNGAMVIRKVDMSTDLISTVAGNGAPESLGDGLPAIAAAIGDVAAIRFDKNDQLYLSTVSAATLRRIAPSLSGAPGTGVIETIAGVGTAGFSPDGTLATSASLSTEIFGLAIHPTTGEVYFTDTYNHRIRRIDADGKLQTVVGTGTAGYNGEGQAPTATKINFPTALTFDATGGLVLSDAAFGTGNGLIRRAGLSGGALTTCAPGSACTSDDGCFSGNCEADVCAAACGNTATDVNNCGACGNVCPGATNGTATCSAGVCAFTCNTGYWGSGTACAAWTACTAGEIVNFAGSATADRTCSLCGAGSYSTGLNATSCTACDPGFTSAQGAASCSDIDECAVGTAGCSPHASCGNLTGSFTCTCHVGFSGNGTTCANNPPVVTVTGSAAVNEGGTYTYSFTATDVGGSVTGINVACGSGGSLVAQPAFAAGETVTGSFQCAFPDGPASPTVSVTATDNLGANGGANLGVAVGNVAPTATIAGAASGDHSWEGTAINLTGSATDPGDDTVALAWTVTKDGADYATGAGAGFSFTPDDDGTYVVTLTATDSDGAVGTKQSTFLVDNVVPEGAFLASHGAVSEGTPVTFTVNATDASTLDQGALHYYIDCTGSSTLPDGVDYASTADNGNTTTCTFGSGPANATVTAFVFDDSGAVSSVISLPVTVQNVAPKFESVSSTAGTESTGATTVTATFTDPGVNDTITCNVSFASGVEVTGVLTRTATGGTCTASYVYPDSGTYSPTVTLFDGDASVSQAASVTVDNQNPTPSIAVATDPLLEGAPITLNASATDASPADQAAPFTWAWTVTGNGQTVTGTGASLTFTPNNNGTYVVTLTATDKDGGAGTVSENIIVSDVAPSIKLDATSASVNEGQSITLTLTDSDPGALDTLSYAYNCYGTSGTTPPAFGSPVAFSGTASLPCAYDDGPATYWVWAKVCDGERLCSTATRSVEVKNVAPTATVSAASRGRCSARHVPGAPIVVSLSNPYDVSGADTSSGFHYAFDCAGGALASASYASSDLVASATCTFADAGAHTISAAIIDKDGGKTVYTTTVSAGGRMTGGGRIGSASHGMTLHCDAKKGPNNLEVNWGRCNKFHLEALTSASCIDNPNIGPQNPASHFDTLVGTGVGRYNGQPATVEFTFTDAGEPGRNDYGQIVIKQGTRIIATFEGNLRGGNHQAHAN